MRLILGILTTLAFAAPGAAAPQDWEHVRSIGLMDLVVVDRSLEKDKDVYRLAIGSICAARMRDRGICKVLFWSDPALVPKAMPMSEAEADALRANWTWNGTTGHRSLLWSCDIDPDPKTCFR